MDGRKATSMAAFMRTKYGIAGAVSVLVYLALGGLTLFLTDREKREELLQQGRLVAQTLDVEQVKSLTGSAADLQNPNYLRIKKQFSAVKAARPSCRFVYLAGRKTAGEPFIYVDNEPPDSKDYSPPGDPYYDASPALLTAFHTISGVVGGPDADRWGTWVSALVPIRNAATGDAIAVLGMDVDARAWHRDVVLRAALPLSLLLGLAIVILVLMTAATRGTSGSRPVLRQVFPVLTAFLVLLVLGGITVTVYLHRRQNMESDPIKAVAIVRDLHLAVEKQSFQLLADLQPVLNSPQLGRDLCSFNAEHLLADWQPLFERLHREERLTHFAFFDTNRVCLLRVHKPSRRGDVVDSFVLQEAGRTGMAAFGLELWPRDTLSIRVVQPVVRNGVLLGYVEMGCELEEILRQLSAAWPDSHLAVAVHKALLDRPSWEESMRALGRKPEWDRLARNVIVFSSRGELPAGLNAMADRDPQGGPVCRDTTREIRADGRLWHVVATPLQDAAGREIGDLVVIHDAVLEAAVFRQVMVLAVSGSMILLAAG